MPNSISAGQSKWISFISFAASILILTQILVIIFSGEAACLNQGCKVVENLTTIPPLSFNLIGFLYFQSVCWVFFLARNRGSFFVDLSSLLLLTGLAVEGVLVAYQINVARAACSYCLILFAALLLCNALGGRKQFLDGIAVLAGLLVISSMLSYGPSVLLSRQQTINNGTYGTRTCFEPKKELYLFFSENCPHCKNVIQALEGCSSCNFHFNPVEKLDDFDLDGLVRTDSYDPELNTLLLKLLGIDSIPVLFEKNQSGFSVIKGEQQIIRYTKQACFLTDPLLYLDSDAQSQEDEISIFSAEGECSLTIDCAEDEKMEGGGTWSE